jgi:predicted helicase
MQYQLPKVFAGENRVMAISGSSAAKPFSVLAVKDVYSYDLLEKTQGLPFYRYSETGGVDNVTNWALKVFGEHYSKLEARITKEDIFHYVYAVLHSPLYREKYAINLKREFPRIPFYDDFEKWAEWGRQLMDMHLNYEQVEPYKLIRSPLFAACRRKRGIIDWGHIRLSSGCSNATRSASRKIPPSARNSTPIASPITRNTSSIC